MKKIVSMLLAVAMFCSMNLTATAAWPTDVVRHTYYYTDITNGDGYEIVQRFSEEYAAVYPAPGESSRWCFIDKEGNVAFTDDSGNMKKYAYVAPFASGKALVGTVKGSDSKMEMSILKSDGTEIQLKKADGNSVIITDLNNYFINGDRSQIKAYTFNEGYLCIPNNAGYFDVFDENGNWKWDTFTYNDKTYHAQEVYSDGFFKGKTEDGEIAFFSIGVDDEAAKEIGFKSKYTISAEEYKVTDVYSFKDDYTCIRLEKGTDKFFAVIDKETCKKHLNESLDFTGNIEPMPCQGILVDLIAGSVGYKAIRYNGNPKDKPGNIIYKVNNKYKIYNVKNKIFVGDINGYDEITTSMNGAIMVRNAGKYTLLNSNGGATSPELKDLDYGKLCCNGTVIAVNGDEKRFYEYHDLGLLELNIENKADFADVFDDDIAFEYDIKDSRPDNKFICVKKGVKEGKNVYGFAKLSVDKPAGTQGGGVNPKMNFIDVPANAWYYSDLKSAFDAGIINGKTANEFKPNDNMTHAEAIKLAACLHQKVTTGKVTLENGNPWYQPYVDYCEENGIIDRKYDYNTAATRGGYMMIFANALPEGNLAEINEISDDAIPDVKMDSPFAKAAYKLYRAGIVGGSDEAHNCKPFDNIKRSEVATILARMMFEDKRIEFTLGTPPQTDDKVNTGITGSTENAGNSIEDATGGDKQNEETTTPPPTPIEFKIVKEPTSSTIEKGGKALLTIKVEGGKEPYEYQWQDKSPIKGWEDCTDGTNIKGSKTNELTVEAVASGVIEFMCIIKDAEGNKLESQVVKVTVN